MLENWLQPLSDEALRLFSDTPGCMGAAATHFRPGMSLPPELQIALIGLNTQAATSLRSALYALQAPASTLIFYDLGDLRKENPDFLIPVLRELLEAGVLPVLVGAEPTWTRAQYRAHRELQGAVSLAVIDERLAYQQQPPSNDYLQGILDHPEADLFHLSLLAAQAPFVPGEHFALLDARHHECLRLGALRGDISDAEPLLRDADMLSVQLRALKFSDAPGVADPSPNGLQAEEACQLMRYAGISDKLRSLGLYGLEPENDLRDQTAQLAAQMLWYFLEGFSLRHHDFPISSEGMTEYLTDTQSGMHLSFWKSARSGRWWIQAPARPRGGQERHRLIPCTYADYTMASQGDIPDRLLQAFRRYE